MGKSKNIKRLQKLKVVKKKREQKLLDAKRIEFAEAALAERIRVIGGVLARNTGPMKSSDLLLNFIEPIAAEYDITDLDTWKANITLGMCAWNVSVLRDHGVSSYEKMRSTFISLSNGEPNTIEEFNFLVERRSEKFGEFNFIYKDFELTPKTKVKVLLTVVIIPIEEILSRINMEESQENLKKS